MKEMVEALRRLDAEQEAKLMELRDLLARAESMRRKDFDTLMSQVWSERRLKEEVVAQGLDIFLEEQDNLVAWLKGVVYKDNMGLDDFRATSQMVLARQKGIETELVRLLRELHLEQEEMETGLRSLLAKGNSVRVRDFKALLKAVRLRQTGRRDDVGRLLDELWSVDEGVASRWSKVTSLTTV